MIRLRALRLLLLGLVPACLLSCSDHNNPTSPPPGGSSELNGNLPTTGSQYAHVFTKTGSFAYKCSIHPTCTSLQGTIVVADSGTWISNDINLIHQTGGSSGPYGSTCSSLSVQRDTILVGEQVIWRNDSPLPHTVTSQ